MKLATVRVEHPASESERRDGRLVVVDDRAGAERGVAAIVPIAVAPNLLAAIEQWDAVEPKLREIDAALKAGTWDRTMRLADARFMAPLPRTWSWLDGSAFIQHVLLVRKARGAQPPEDLRTVPLMYQGVSEGLLGPRDDIAVESESYGIDLEAEIAVVLDDVPMGTKAADAEAHIRLLVLMNDVSLRALIPRELAAGFGFFHGKPASSFGPFAVTPDDPSLAAPGPDGRPAWRDGRLHLPMHAQVNGARLGDPDCGAMHFSFPQLIEHAAKTRHLPAGTILGSGTVSNEDESRGVACLAERRMLEQIKTGQATTPWLRFGDRITIDVREAADSGPEARGPRGSGHGRSVFGVIDQRVVQYLPSAPPSQAPQRPESPSTSTIAAPAAPAHPARRPGPKTRASRGPA